VDNLVQQDVIRDYLERYSFIDFALLFGSHAEKRAGRLSDVDVGIYISRDLPLIERGRMIAGLEAVLTCDVDIVLLNDSYKANPVFAFEILNNCKLLFVRDREKFIDFKKNALQYYMDTQPLRKMVEAALKTRLQSNRFGVRGNA
jgi:hypothetical protein